MHFQPWSVKGFLLERYQFEPGPVVPLAAHSHEAIQLCFNSGSIGQYVYRRRKHSFPSSSLTVINSGEAHAPGYLGEFTQPTSFHMLYMHPSQLHLLAKELGGKGTEAPYFPSLVLKGQSPATRFLLLAHKVFETDGTSLDAEVYLLLFQMALLRYHTGQTLSERRVKEDHPALKRVREYIHAHYSHPLTLTQLADIACLSEYHLCRIFSRRFGTGLHNYVNNLRVDAAKHLLLKKRSLSETASKVGFYDSSHLVRHFKHVVGFSPSKYH